MTLRMKQILMTPAGALIGLAEDGSVWKYNPDAVAWEAAGMKKAADGH